MVIASGVGIAVGVAVGAAVGMEAGAPVGGGGVGEPASAMAGVDSEVGIDSSAAFGVGEAVAAPHAARRRAASSAPTGMENLDRYMAAPWK